jgi:hypothetical protein
MTALDEVRELHIPWDDLTCKGCDYGGYEAEDPAWPCRTAAIVYNEAEIAEITERMKTERAERIAKIPKREPTGYEAWLMANLTAVDPYAHWVN